MTPILRIMYGGCIAGIVTLLWIGQPALAQEEATAESLRLPEVVITGIDRSKIQRIILKAAPQEELPTIFPSVHDQAAALLQQGDALSANQVRNAEEAYTQALSLDTGNLLAFLRLGDVYRFFHRYSEAADMYQKVLQCSPNHQEAHYKLGRLYEHQLRKVQQAVEHYEHYLQSGGTDRRVEIWLRHLSKQAL